jgi:hypothetical protein
MSTEIILTETFAGHEYLAPQPHELLPDILAGARTRRRRRAVAGSCLAVVAVAAGAVATGSALGGGGGGGVPVTQAGSPAPRSQPPAGPTTPVVTVAAGWLPLNAREVGRSAVYGHSSRSYLIGPSVYLTIGSGAADKDPSGKPTRTTINGRPATEWASRTSYDLRFAFPSGAVGRVNVIGNIPAADARSIGRAAATGARDTVRVTVAPVDFTIGTPPRTVPAGISRADGRGTVYTFAPAGTHGPVQVTRQVQVSSSTASRGVPKVGQQWFGPDGRPSGVAKAGRAVFGHPSVYVSWGNGITLWVTTPRGRVIELTGGNQVITLDGLYRLAATIRE